MSFSTVDSFSAVAAQVEINDNELVVRLTDGRSITVPIAWYPRLSHGTAAERQHWRLIGNGRGIHWPDLDEDISIENLLAGRPSGESQSSLKKWLDQRQQKTATPRL